MHPKLWSCRLIHRHYLISGEPRESSIGIQTDKVVHTGVMFLPGLSLARKCLGIDINSMHVWGSKKL